MAADREFIRDTYGQRSNVGRRQASVDGLTWSAGANGPSQISTAVGRFAASNSRLGSRTWVAAINQSNKIFVTRFVLGGSWTFITELPHVVYYHPGIASSSSTALSVAYQVHLSWANGFTDIKKRTSSNEGSTWGTPVAIKDGSGVEFGTAAPGVAHTYNPDTATYITMARGTGFGGPSINRAMYQSGSSAWDQFLDVISSDTPAIACGSAVTLGTRNCLIAWTDGTSWTGTIKWKQCQMTTGSFSNCSAIRSLGYFGVGSASVAYVGNNNGYPWQIAISQGGASVYTWRKQPADTASFQDQRSFSYSPQAILPAVGSLAESGVDHRYVFTMDD
jgi:hypothetical protein